MNKQTKSILIFTPKAIIFGLALLNYLYIQAQIPQVPAGGAPPASCFYCVWYLTSSFNDVLILLTASVFLLISRNWSYIIASLLSGYIVVYGSILFLTRSISMLEVWDFVQKNDLNIFLQWEIQFILATIIFTATILYLFLSFVRKNRVIL